MAKNKEHPTLKFVKHKWYIFLLLLITMFIGVLGGYISGPLQRDKSLTLFIIDALVLVGLAIIDMVIIFYIRNKMKKDKSIHKDLMFYTFFICLFFSGLVLTIFFRLLAIYKPDSFLNKGNLISLVCSLTYLLLLALAVFFPLEKQSQEVIDIDTNTEEDNLPVIIEDKVTEEVLIEPSPIMSEETIEEKIPNKEEVIITPIVETPIEVVKEEVKVIPQVNTTPTITKEDIYNALKELKVDEIVKEEVSKEQDKQKEAAKPTMVLAVFNGPILAQYYNKKEEK